VYFIKRSYIAMLEEYKTQNILILTLSDWPNTYIGDSLNGKILWDAYYVVGTFLGLVFDWLVRLRSLTTQGCLMLMVTINTLRFNLVQ
jgi:hypothetical protein